MPNPNPNTSGLEPGKHKRQKGPGESIRLSAYLTTAEQERLEQHLTGRTPYERSREIARLLMHALD